MEGWLGGEIIKDIFCFLRHNFTAILSYSLHNDVKSNSTKASVHLAPHSANFPPRRGGFLSLLVFCYAGFMVLKDAPRKKKVLTPLFGVRTGLRAFKAALNLKASCEYIFFLLTFLFSKEKVRERSVPCKSKSVSRCLTHGRIICANLDIRRE